MNKTNDYFSPKVISILIILFLHQDVLLSQNESKFFVELNLAKTTVTKSLFDNSTYNTLSFINGLRVGKSFKNNAELFLTLQKERSVTDLALIGSYSIFRHQIGLGGNVELLSPQPLSLSLGGELLVNFNRHSGYYTSDAPFFFYSLDNLRTTEMGAATLFQLRYSLNSRLSIILNSRIGIYHREASKTEGLTIEKSTYQIFEPLNMLAFRVNI